MSTFFLLHGAYQGGWIWNPVAERLRARGHRAIAPSLDGCGDRKAQVRTGITTESQAEEVAERLYYEDLRDVILAGTSAGGMVACKVAELAPDRISRVVFVDALALKDGERISDFVNRPTAVSTELTTGPTREDAEARLFSGLEPTLRQWALDRVTMHPVAAMNEPVKLPKFWAMPWQASVVYCRQAANPGEAHQRRAAEALSADWHELDTGHYPMLSMPDELTAILDPTGT